MSGPGTIGVLAQPATLYGEGDFVRYGVRDGLSDNAITCLQQDDRGYLWIGTGAGLNRFDGHAFTAYYQGTAPLLLPSANIWRLKRFGDHHLGIISKGGFRLLDTRTYAVSEFRIPDTTAFTAYLNSAWDAEALPDHGFAVTTAAGFYVFRQDGSLAFRHDAHRLDEIGKKRILYGRDIVAIAPGMLLLYVDEHGMARYETESQTFSTLEATDTVYAPFMGPRLPGDSHWVVKGQVGRDEYVFVPDHNDVIVYYHHGLKKEVISPLPFEVHETLNWESRIAVIGDSLLAINDRTNGFYLLPIDRRSGRIQCDGKKYLPGYKILSLFADRDRRLWVGTTEGLLKQNVHQPDIRTFRYPPASGGKYGWGFTCTYRHGQWVYAGRFAAGHGLAVIRAADMRLEKEVTFFEVGSPWNQVISIESYHPDTLWVGTVGGLLWYDTASGRYGRLQDLDGYAWCTDFYAVMAPPHPDGNAWMCSLLGGRVVRYHLASRQATVYSASTRPKLPFDKVKSIVYDAHGDVWIGGHSLARWNNRLQDFDTLITVYAGANKFSDDIVALSADADGSLWLHNAGNGLLEYRVAEKRFVAYTMNDGLPSDVLQSLSLVHDHRLWIASNNHLTLFDTRTKKCTVYGTDDGLPEQRPTGRRIMLDPTTGMLYLCSNEYLSVFPLSPRIRADRSSGLFVEALTMDDRRTYYFPDRPLQTNYDRNQVRVRFTVVDFDKSNYQFAYRLQETEPWTAIGRQRDITLSNLPPGVYSLQLRASGMPGVEKLVAVPFSIRPPFWKTAWFIAGAILFLAGGIYAVFRMRVRRIRQRANLDKLLAQTEMKALQAQMNPHFIFNSLNSIGEMILNQENREASHYLSKFARLIRITLDQSSQALVSLRNTIDYLERYMEMEHIRNSHFTHAIMVDPALDIDDTWVPPMLIQPFIENALWHGVTSSRRDIHVRIGFRQERGHLVCTIEDNGIGIRQSSGSKTDAGGRHAPVGIANIQNRLALLNEKYNLHADIRVVDKKDVPGATESGTLVTLLLPLDIEET